MTTTTTETEPATPMALRAELRYAQPGQLTEVRFLFGDSGWITAGGWTQNGDTFTAADGTSWSFTAADVIPGPSGAVAYRGWFLPAGPAR